MGHLDEGVEEEVDSFADYSSFLLPPHSYPGCTERERHLPKSLKGRPCGIHVQRKEGKMVTKRT